MGDTQARGRGVGSVAHGGAAAESGLARSQSVQFHAEGTRQQRIGGRQQGIGARRQARHTVAHRDLAAYHRIARALLGRDRRHGGLRARNDGVDRIGRQSRQHEAVARHLHQRMQASVGGTSAPGQKARPRQFTAAGQIDPRTVLNLDAVRRQLHIAQAAAQPGEPGFRSGIVVAQAVDRATVGHDQSRGADGRDTARAQHDPARFLVIPHGNAKLQHAQRRANHAALVDIGRPQAQGTEGRVRHRRHRAIAAALDAQAALGIEGDLIGPPLVENPFAPRGHVDHRAGGRIDLAAGQKQVAFGRQGSTVTDRMLEESQIVLAAQLQLLEAVTLDQGLAALHRVAIGAEPHPVEHVQHAGLDAQPRVVLQRDHPALVGSRIVQERYGVLILARAGSTRQAHVGRGQVHAGTDRRPFRQNDRARCQVQALAQREIHAIAQGKGAVDQHGQAAETARLDAIRAKTAMAVDQFRIGLARTQPGRQALGRLLLEQLQFTMHKHAIGRIACIPVGGRFQRQGQRAAGGADAPRRRLHVAIEIQAVEAGQMDHSTVGSQQRLAQSGQIQLRRGARSVQARAGPDDDEVVDGIGLGGVGLVCATDFYPAAVQHHAVTAPLRIHRGSGQARRVEHGMATYPHRTVMALQVADILAAETQAIHTDAAAGGAQFAVDIDLAVALQDDAAPRIHFDAGALANGESGPLPPFDHAARVPGGQHEISASALRHPSLAGIFGEQRREPLLQRLLRIGAGGHPARRGQIGLQDRHRRAQIGAFGHGQTIAARHLVTRETLLEARGIQMQQRPDRHRLRQGRARADQGARGIGHLAGGDGAGLDHAGRRRDRDATGQDGGIHDIVDGKIPRVHDRRDDRARRQRRRRAPAIAIDREVLAIGKRHAVADVLVGRLRQRPGGAQRDPACRIAGNDLWSPADRLARIGVRADVVIVHRQHRALGYGESLAGDQIDQRSLARLQDPVAAGDLPADDHRVAGLQGQRPAAFDAVAAQLAFQHKPAFGSQRRRVGVGDQCDVAALAAPQAVVGHERRARRNVEQRARAHPHVAAATHVYTSAVDEGQAAHVGAVLQQIAPQAACVQRHAVADRDARHVARRHGRRQRKPLPARAGIDVPVDHVAQDDGAATRRQVGVDVDLRGMQGDFSARSDRHRCAHLDAALGIDPQAAEVQRVEPGCLQRDVAARAAYLYRVDHGARTMAQVAAIGVVDRCPGADDQFAVARDGCLRLPVAVEPRLARPLLPLALVGAGLDIALQRRRARRHHQPAAVAAHRIAILQALPRCDDGVVEVLLGGVAPTRSVGLETPVQAAIQQVARRRRGVVQAAVRALEPGLGHIAGLHVQRAARQIDQRTLARQQTAATELHGAALRRPFADAMAGDAKIAADLQQAARRVPAIRFIAIGAGRHQDQVAAIEPDIAVAQLVAVAIHRSVALLEALHIDQDIVRLHRDAHADVAGDVDRGAVLDLAGARRIHVDLAAGGQGQAIAFEAYVAAADDLHQRLVAPVGNAVARLVAVLDQGLALYVQCRRSACIEHDGGDPAARQANLRGVAAARRQVDGASRVHRGRRHRDAALAHVVTGQRNIAGGCLDQAGVARQATGATLQVLRADDVAARGRVLIRVGTHALLDHEGIAGRQHCLAAVGRDLARVVHLAAQQQHIAAALGHRLRNVRGDPRAPLHHHLPRRRPMAVAAGRRVQVIGEARDVPAALPLAVQPLLELAVGHPRRGRRQVAHVHLARSAEYDPVAVHDHHRPRRLDPPLDLAWTRLWIVHPVQHRPVRLLVERHRRLLTDVERLPVQDRLVRRLLDRHLGLTARRRLHRILGVEPARRQAVGIDLQAALAQAVRHRRSAGLRRLPRRLLQRLLRRDRLRRQVQVVDRGLQLLPRRRRLLLGRRQRRSRQAIGQPPRRRRRALRRTLGREPGRAEGLLRMRTAGRASRRQGQRDGMGQRRPTQPGLVVAEVSEGACAAFMSAHLIPSDDSSRIAPHAPESAVRASLD